jgi:hypothetical protein
MPRGIPLDGHRAKNKAAWDATKAEQIYAYIRAGAFPHVAALAAGLPRDAFKKWLKFGQRRKSVFAEFVDRVEQARAQARVVAEVKTFQDDPAVWLKSGPGKEMKDDPGWTSAIKPQITQQNQHFNLMLSPQMAGIFGALFQVLAPFPEALTAVQQCLGNGQGKAPKTVPNLEQIPQECQTKTSENPS